MEEKFFLNIKKKLGQVRWGTQWRRSTTRLHLRGVDG